MNTILLHANPDSGLDTRLGCALALSRRLAAKLIALHVTPLDAFVMGDPFGGIYALPTMVDQYRRNAETQEATISERLAREEVEWEWVAVTAAAAQGVVERARLADLILVGQPGEGHPGRNSMVPDLLVHARQPVLVVPDAVRDPDLLSGPAMIAWDGSVEAANALRLSLPLLRLASAVRLVTVGGGAMDFPAAAASLYLGRAGVNAEAFVVDPAGRSVADSLLGSAAEHGASLIVMGAYGHTRLREAVLGGATRDMLYRSALPLLLAH